MKLFAGLEADGFAGGDADFGAGPGIAPYAGFARTDAEDAEAAQFDAVAGRQRLLEAFKDCIHSRFGLGPRQACALDDVMHDVLFDQCPAPSIEKFGKIRRLSSEGCLGGMPERPTGEMLLGVGGVVNLRLLQYHKQLRDSVSRLMTNGERKLFRMSIQSDRWIREQALQHGMIEPFSEKQVREGVISYGLSSYGYDLRVSDEFKIFTNVNSAIIDPKAFDERSFVSVQAESVIVPPNSFALARSVEYFRIPRDVISVCVGKSTYARCGIIVNVTPFEPEWEGYVTLEISNTTPLPARVYANEGLCQILFFRGSEPCEVSYADRKGKYQKQQGIVLPRL